MPKFEFEIVGLDQLGDAAVRLAPKIIQGASAALYQFAEEVMTASKEVVPVDTGNLKSTGHVGRHEPPGVKEGFVYREGDELIIDMGYGDSAVGYALYVHEDLVGDHPVSPNWSWAKAEAAGKSIQWSAGGTGPKYLEGPFLAKQGELSNRIAEAINAALKG